MSTLGPLPARRAARARLPGCQAGTGGSHDPTSWRDQFGPEPPYPVDADTLFIAYYASAELGCHRVLQWAMPARILDLFAEFRDRTNGRATPAGAGLLGALAYFSLDAIGAIEKEEMRALIMSGGSWSRDERERILDYCEGDVEALARLLPTMLPSIDLPRALVRGRYMAAASAMEHNGVPVDVGTLPNCVSIGPASRAS